MRSKTIDLLETFFQGLDQIDRSTSTQPWVIALVEDRPVDEDRLHRCGRPTDRHLGGTWRRHPLGSIRVRARGCWGLPIQKTHLGCIPFPGPSWMMGQLQVSRPTSPSSTDLLQVSSEKPDAIAQSLGQILPPGRICFFLHTVAQTGDATQHLGTNSSRLQKNHHHALK